MSKVSLSPCNNILFCFPFFQTNNVHNDPNRCFWGCYTTFVCVAGLKFRISSYLLQCEKKTRRECRSVFRKRSQTEKGSIGHFYANYGAANASLPQVKQLPHRIHKAPETRAASLPLHKHHSLNREIIQYSVLGKKSAPQTPS